MSSKEEKLIVVDSEVWHRFKVYCLKNRFSISTAIEDLIEKHLERKGE